MTAYTQITKRIRQAEIDAGREEHSVTLIGVSKYQPGAKIRQAAAEGLKNVGENYLQEALAKQTELSDLNLQWHFIGHIQSNKTSTIAEHFDWVHSIDRLKIARRINEQRAPKGVPIKVFIQINLDEETSKSGISAYNDAVELATYCLEAENLELMGLMSIPKAYNNYQQQLASFQNIAEFAERLREEVAIPKNLSMGMSGDLEAAIAAGATHIRVGTALFGQRKQHV